MDFKVRRIKTHRDNFVVGKIYEVKNGRIIDEHGACQANSGNVADVDSLNEALISQFELVTDKPHICEILGNGKPLGVNEEFGIEGHSCKYRVNSDGRREGFFDGTWDVVADEKLLLYAINHPEKIIRQPQFSDLEVAGLKALVMFEFPFLARDKDGCTIGFQSSPHKYDAMWASGGGFVRLPKTLFPQIKWTDNEPFSIVGYLEGLK